MLLLKLVIIPRICCDRWLHPVVANVPRDILNFNANPCLSGEFRSRTLGNLKKTKLLFGRFFFHALGDIAGDREGRARDLIFEAKILECAQLSIDIRSQSSAELPYL